jgi:hypothetical protein
LWVRLVGGFDGVEGDCVLVVFFIFCVLTLSCARVLEGDGLSLEDVLLDGEAVSRVVCSGCNGGGLSDGGAVFEEIVGICGEAEGSEFSGREGRVDVAGYEGDHLEVVTSEF